MPNEAPGWLDDLVSNVRDLHEEILRYSKGSAGEHTDRLMASCARPFQTAFGEQLFKSGGEQAAALFHGIITSHAFVDGNKRTATLAAMLFLMATTTIERPTDLQARLLGEVAVETAVGGLDVEQVADWLRRIFGSSA